MGGWTGIWQWVVVLAIVLLLFGGRGKISALMGDIGKGLKSFKKGMNDGEKDASVAEGDQPKAIDAEAATVVEASTKTDEAAKT
ncbi:MAG: twin-arginine translocase TatA/TatE family subunit [Rhodospirillales bacterium]|nr:twin-arginine translocase TatA/TatE family subunit [Rhodospirillales bacterium]